MLASSRGLSAQDGRISVEQLLRISEERFRLLFEAIPAGAFVWDGEQTVYINAAAERMSGYTREEMTTVSPWTLVHPDSLPYLLEARDRNPRGRNISLHHELKMVRKDGSVCWVFLTMDWAHLTDTDGLMIGIATDITERKLGEDALRLSEARYRILYQDNPSMYFTVDPDGTVLDVNAFGASQLGYERHQLVGQPVLDIFHPDDRAGVRRQMRALLAKPGETAVWQFRKVKRDGTVIWVEELARTTQDAEGNTVVLVVCEDVSERRRMEEELVALREELDRKAELATERGSQYALSFRELTVLHLIVDGKSDKEIGAILGITRLTASKHVARILRKLKVNSRTLAGVMAVREGLVE